MLLSLLELIDILIIAGALGFIFSDMIPRKQEMDIPYPMRPRFDANHIIYAASIAAPAIILHEFGHKFVAIAFGMTATFHAAYTWLAIGIVLKLMNFGFFFFVPAYVAISGIGSPLVHSLIAFAGPGVNLLLWIGAEFLLKQRSKKHFAAVYFTKEINKFLFIFNMIPLPMFDGFTVFSGIIKTFFGG